MPLRLLRAAALLGLLAAPALAEDAAAFSADKETVTSSPFAYAKSGASQIAGLIKPGDLPPRGGLYLMDVVPDGEVRFGFPNISDNAEIVEMMASGAHLSLFVTGRGSVVGSALAPVIKIAANPHSPVILNLTSRKGMQKILRDVHPTLLYRAR